MAYIGHIDPDFHMTTCTLRTKFIVDTCVDVNSKIRYCFLHSNTTDICSVATKQQRWIDKDLHICDTWIQIIRTIFSYFILWALNNDA